MADFNGVAETQPQGAPEDVAMAEQFHEHLEGARKRIEYLEIELERSRRVARALESALAQLETQEKAAIYNDPPQF